MWVRSLSREDHLKEASIHGIFQARVLEWGAIAFSAHTHHEAFFSLETHVQKKTKCPSFLCSVTVLLSLQLGSGSPHNQQPV